MHRGIVRRLPPTPQRQLTWGHTLPRLLGSVKVSEINGSDRALTAGVKGWQQRAVWVELDLHLHVKPVLCI